MRSCGNEVRAATAELDSVLCITLEVHRHVPTGGPLDVDQSVIGVFAHM